MANRLPVGWIETTLGEVCASVASIHPENLPDAQFTYFDIGSIDNQTNRVTDHKTLFGRQAPSRARQSVRKDDILFSTVRTYLKKIARIEEDYPNPVASTGFTVIRSVEGVSPKFLFFQILTDRFLEPLHKLQSGSSYPAVRDKDVVTQPIWLAPTQEQLRIVTKLETLLSHVAAGEAAARRALRRLERYRATILNVALTGALSREWRITHLPKATGTELLKRLLAERRARWEEVHMSRLKATGKLPKGENWKKHYREPHSSKTDIFPDMPHDWASASIDQLAWMAGYGTSVKCDADAMGPAVLRIPNIRNGQFDFTDIKFATKVEDITEDDFVAPGDLLLIRTNGSLDLIGRAAVAKSELARRYSFASYLIRFRLVGDHTLWSWVLLCWNSPTIRSKIQSRAATTAGQYNVSLSGLVDLGIPLPPADEQAAIVHEVERRLSAADELAATINNQLERARSTRRSILREAFAGKLVLQDPNDEPASELVKRIRRSRKAKTAKPKEKRMQKTAFETPIRTLLEVLRSHHKPISPEQLFREAGFLQKFEENEYRHEIVEQFYDELRSITGPHGPVMETRPNAEVVLLEVTA